MDTLAPPRLAKLRIVMDREFEEFGQKERDEFLHDLGRVTGCPVDQMKNVTVRRGCVIVELEMSEEAVRAFLEESAKANNGTLPVALSELDEFLKKQRVRNANAEFKVSVQILADRKTKQELLFIHGWTGDAATFADLPKFLGKRFECDTLTYVYPTGWLAHSPSIYFLAQNLDNWFRNYVQAERVAVIVHSMGGLVLRKFLTIQKYRKEPVDNRVKQVTFIASPHDGADLAAIAKKIPGLGSAQIDELSSRSGFIAELKDRWGDWMGQKVPLSCQVRSIYGTDDSIVSPANAIGYDREAVPILGAGHIDITKCRHEKDELVVTLGRFLLDAGFKTPSPPTDSGSRSRQPSL